MIERDSLIAGNDQTVAPIQFFQQLSGRHGQYLGLAVVIVSDDSQFLRAEGIAENPILPAQRIDHQRADHLACRYQPVALLRGQIFGQGHQRIRRIGIGIAAHRGNYGDHFHFRNQAADQADSPIAGSFLF